MAQREKERRLANPWGQEVGCGRGAPPAVGVGPCRQLRGERDTCSGLASHVGRQPDAAGSTFTAAPEADHC